MLPPSCPPREKRVRCVVSVEAPLCAAFAAGPQNAHLVALLTGYHLALATQGDQQHLLPGAKHAFPQQPPSPLSLTWHGKWSPTTFWQHCRPRRTGSWRLAADIA